MSYIYILFVWFSMCYTIYRIIFYGVPYLWKLLKTDLQKELENE